MNIKVDYDITKAEIRAGLRFAYGKVRVIVYLVLAVSILSILLLLFTSTEPLGTFFNLAVAFGILLVAFPIWMFEYVIPVRIAEKLYRAQMSYGRTTMWLTEDGMRVVSEIGESQQKWEIFSKYRENDGLILLCLPNGESFTIPKRMLREEEAEELVGTLDEHLEGEA